MKKVLRMTDEEIAEIEAEIEQTKQQDPNDATPTQAVTQVDTQRMLGDVQMQQQMQQMQMQQQMGMDQPQPKQKSQSNAEKK
jgi:hypothetical protein